MQKPPKQNGKYKAKCIENINAENQNPVHDEARVLFHFLPHTLSHFGG